MRIPRVPTIVLVTLPAILALACWAVGGGLDAHMNVNVADYLYGIRIPKSLSMLLVLCVLGAVPLIVVVAVVSWVAVAVRVARGRAAR